MSRICVTRAIMNAKRLRSLAPDLFPPGGFGESLPLDVLSRLDKMSDDELSLRLKDQPGILEHARQLRAAPLLFGCDPFQGTLHFVELTLYIEADGSQVAPRTADIQTALEYMQLAAKPISAYCSQYGENHLEVSPVVLKYGVSVVSPTFSDDDLQGWVNDIVRQNQLPKDSTCLIFLNTPRSVNTYAKPSFALGYHQKADSSYCFINLLGEGLTVDDRADFYADSLSHEVAEMTCNPDASHFNNEVCDACAGGCGSIRWNFFLEPSPSLANSYIQSSVGIPRGLAYTYYTAAVVRPGKTWDCPASESACAYAPPRPLGISELLFYDRQVGVGEFYAVNTGATIEIQYQQTGWRTSWAQIVSGKFTPRDRFGSDLLFYDPSSGTGEFYTTDAVGGTSLTQSHADWPAGWNSIIPGHFSNNGFDDLLFYNRAQGLGQFSRTDGKGGISPLGGAHTNWRNSWSLIVPGKFSDGPYTDLLFYDPVAGTGEFWQCDGKGNLSLIGSNPDWNSDWSIIVPGNFSGGKYTDLLFYEPSTGTGEFWSPDGRGNISLIQAHTNWRSDWTTILPGNFANSSNTDLLFYEQNTGMSEFWKVDGRGNMSLVRSYNDWRPTWNIILPLV